MFQITVAIFDEYKKIGDAIVALSGHHTFKNLSFIGRSLPDYEAESRIDESILGPKGLDLPYYGAGAGSLSAPFHRFVRLDVSGIGVVIGGGPLIDNLDISRSLTDSPEGGLSEAFKKAGFPEDKAQEYAQLVSNGQLLLFVPSSGPEVDRIDGILSSYGPLEKDVISINTDTYSSE